MPDRYRVNYSSNAVSELEDIVRYIEQDSPQNAVAMINRLLDAVDSLGLLPHRYPVIQDSDALFGREVRSMPVSSYLVRYHVDDSRKVVTLLAVRHGARKTGA